MALIYQLAKMPVNAGMDIYDIRRANLRSLANDPDIGRSTLIQLVDDLSPSYLSQMIGPKPTRTVGSATARKIEKALKKPHGWMDRERTNSPDDKRLRRQSEHALDGVLLKLGIDRDDPLYKDGLLREKIIVTFLRKLQANGVLDDDTVTEIVRLAIELRP